MKKILLSLMIVALASTGAIGATRAYFTSGQVLGSNTFATGTVKLGNFNQSITVTGLTPGQWINKDNVAVYYDGSIAADLYMGAGGASGTDATRYLADKLYVKVLSHEGGATVYEGYVKDLSTNWRKISDNVTAGWQSYDLRFYLDPSTGNDKQGQTNSDTQILIYAVQHGVGQVPSTVPYLSTGDSWFNLL